MASCIFCSSTFSVTKDQQEIRAWREFVSALKEGRLTEENIRPYEELRQQILRRPCSSSSPS